MHGAILYISALKNAHGAGSPKKRHTSIGAKPKESHCLDSVSYTHLTLPTKA